GTTILYPDKRLKGLGERDGFAVLNVAPTMQSYADLHKFFFHGFANTAMGSGHWNQLGHSFTGALIAKELRTILAGVPAAAPSTPVQRTTDHSTNVRPV